MENLFLTVLTISMTTSVVIVAVTLLGTLINKRYVAKWKYWLWIVLALRLLIPLNYKLSDVQFQIRIPAEVGSMEVSEVFGSKSPALEDPYTEPQAPEDQYTKPQIEASAPIKPDIRQKSKSSITMLQALGYLWAAGVVCLLNWQLAGFFCFKRRILRGGKAVEEPVLLVQLQELCRELGIRKNIIFIIHEKADSPMVIGFWKPVLVLPKAEYTWDESFYILRHELIHMRRNDVLVKFLLLLARDFHWFNPVIYLMHSEAVVDMELACDEAVVRGSSYGQREAYTETLMSTLSRQQHKGPLLSTQFSGGKRVMKKRFKNILTKAQKKNGFILFAAILVLTVAVGTMANLAVEATTADGSEMVNTPKINNSEAAPLLIYNFQQEDVAVIPEVPKYSYEDAVQSGEVWKIDGMFPAMGTGTWYIVDVDGVEYYYGKNDTSDPENNDYEAYFLYGWSIVDDSYELANGIKVGMKESEILEQYPNMAVIDFEGNFIYDKVTGFMGWNGGCYPHSYVGMDSDWNYEGKDYLWTDQFDYIMIADIDLNGADALPIYLGLLIKDHVVAAITFYYPTVG
ncbi:MAG: M56 family metallopeptidase [Agathobacter sp.]|nr:M56 family metallopeptidase [Agathobacter sp.]